MDKSHVQNTAFILPLCFLLAQKAEIIFANLPWEFMIASAGLKL